MPLRMRRHDFLDAVYWRQRPSRHHHFTARVVDIYSDGWSHEQWGKRESLSTDSISVAHHPSVVILVVAAIVLVHLRLTLRSRVPDVCGLALLDFTKHSGNIASDPCGVGRCGGYRSLAAVKANVEGKLGTVS